MDERLLNPISTRELERRWSAARRHMAEHNVDALVMQSNNDWLGGNVRWFTDTPLSNGYPRSVIFPANDLMTVVDMGARGARRTVNGDDESNRGVGEMIFTPAFTSVGYTDEYQAELVAEELQHNRYRTIGWVGSGAMPHSFVAPRRARPRWQGPIRRCDRIHRRAQGDQERGRERSDLQSGANAGPGIQACAGQNPPRHDRQ